MPHATLNQLIRSVIPDAEAAELELETEVEATRTPATPAVGVPEAEVEKLASVLEFLGQRGIENILTKQANNAPVTNAGKQPGGTGELDIGSMERGTHHPALASNESAINYDQREKSKKTSPALKAVLKETPFADPVLKQKLTNAGGKGDPNIHSKAASAGHEDARLDEVRAELARRAAAAAGRA